MTPVGQLGSRAPGRIRFAGFERGADGEKRARLSAASVMPVAMASLKALIKPMKEGSAWQGGSKTGDFRHYLLKKASRGVAAKLWRISEGTLKDRGRRPRTSPDCPSPSGVLSARPTQGLQSVNVNRALFLNSKA